MSSPFKFLDAYTKEDQNLFFGRDDEVEELYQRVFKSNLLLVYGASGSGKTSLIQCGLSSKFSDENWFSVYIRRKDNINNSLLNSVISHGVTKLSIEDLDPNEPEIIQRIEGLYLDHFKPIYLVFDQLEELFILGDEKEQHTFYQNIKWLIDSNIQCTVVLIIREEYIAFLSSMEETIPNLFSNRVRIEKMRNQKVKEVITKSCDTISDVTIENKAKFVNQVIKNISEDDLTVELTHLQVYLDKLYKNAEIKDNKHVFNETLLKKTGKVQNVLTQFLEDQVKQLPDDELGWKVLKEFITKDGTKKSTSTKKIKRKFEAKGWGINSGNIQTVISHFLKTKILTEIEESPNLLEFTHDSLAIRTFEKLDARERTLFDIQSLIEQQLHAYNNKGILLSRDNLNYISPYIEDLTLNQTQQKFILKSRRALTKKRKWQIVSTVSIIVILSALTLFSGIKFYQAKKAQEVAEQQRAKASKAYNDLVAEQNKRKTLEITKLFENAESFIRAIDTETSSRNQEVYKKAALDALEKIKSIDSSKTTHDKVSRFKKTFNL